LEVGAVLLGYSEPDCNRIVVERIDRNQYVEPYSPDETMIDGETMRQLEALGRGVVVGCMHTHMSTEPVRCSDTDLRAWRETARVLEQRFSGLIAAPAQTWEAGFPAASWEASDLQLRAWLADSSSDVTECIINKQPQWKAELEAARAFAEAVDPLA
jgi:hypothetical protein